MQFNAVHIYSHTADEVFAALTDFEAVKSKYEAVGQSEVQLVRRDEGDDGSITLVTTRVVPLELPGFAKRVLSPNDHRRPDRCLVRAGRLRRAHRDVRRRSQGHARPRSEAHSILLHRECKGCTNTTDVTVECKVPLIGGKITDLVASDTRRALDHEHTWMSEHLASS